MWKRISRIHFNKNLLTKMQAEKSTKQLLQANKKQLDDLLKRRYVFFQGFQIYGGCAGLYDFGPVGCAIKNNLETLWREHFVLEEDMLEINTTCITPAIVLENSGHVARFTDLMVKDAKTNQGFRADKLLTEWIQTKLIKEKAKLNQVEVKKLKDILVHIDGLTKQELTKIFADFKIKSPDTGNQLTNPEPFNLMFKTQIGPTGYLEGYLRPETAQGMFVNFNKLVEYTGGRMPFAAAQIGLGFRNEIAPRNGLIRVREFQMAEIQHFLDPNDKKHPKFYKYKNFKLPLFSKEMQVEHKDPVWMEIGQAIDKGIVDNETLGYFLIRIYEFLRECGINVKDHLRFRQHLSSEMAHYAKDCWDGEIETSAGWIECVGCADRSAFDLSHHAKGSGQRMVAARKFKEPKPQQQTTINVQKKIVGKEFKKDSQVINTYLDSLDQSDKASFFSKFQQDKAITFQIEGKKFTLEQKHIKIEQKIVNVMEEKYIPSVIEPTFGLGRILTAIFEHSFQTRGGQRSYLCLKPRMAPVKVSILPLQYNPKIYAIVQEIRQRCKRRGVSCKVDDSGQSIGKRYSRTDEIGIPFGITVDYDTLEDQTITLRELHSMKQIRLPMKELETIVCELALEQINWVDVSVKFPAFNSTEKDEKEQKDEKK